jgi:hypothetical protein
LLRGGWLFISDDVTGEDFAAAGPTGSTRSSLNLAMCLSAAARRSVCTLDPENSNLYECVCVCVCVCERTHQLREIIFCPGHGRPTPRIVCRERLQKISDTADLMAGTFSGFLLWLIVWRCGYSWRGNVVDYSMARAASGCFNYDWQNLDAVVFPMVLHLD